MMKEESEMNCEHVTSVLYEDCGGTLDVCSLKMREALFLVSDYNMNKVITNLLTILKKQEFDCCYQRHKTHKVRVKYSYSKFVALYNSVKYFDLKFDEDVENYLISDLHNLLMKHLNEDRNNIYILRALEHLYKNCCFKYKKDELMEIIRKSFYSPSPDVVSKAKTLLSVVVSWYNKSEKLNEIKKLLDVADWDKCHFYLFYNLAIVNHHYNKKCYKLLAEKVISGFSANYSSHAASMMFCGMIEKTSFDNFKTFLYPAFYTYIVMKRRPRTLSTSLENYFIPTCSRIYREDFLKLCTKTNANFMLHVLRFMSEKNIVVDKHIDLLRTVLQHPTHVEMKLAFQILCKYGQLKSDVLPCHIELIKEYLSSLKEYDKTYILSYEHFLSQICIILGKSEDSRCAQYIHFVKWIYELCKKGIVEKEENELFCEIYAASVKILTGNSSTLKTSYTVPSDKCFDEYKNPLFVKLTELGEFNFLTKQTSHDFINTFINRVDNITPLGKLIQRYFMKDFTPEHLESIRNQLKCYLYTSNLSTSKKCLQNLILLMKHDNNIELKQQIGQQIISALQNQYYDLILVNRHDAIDKYPLFICLNCLKTLIETNEIEFLDLDHIFKFCKTAVSYFLYHCKFYSYRTIENPSKITKAIEYTIMNAVDVMYQATQKLSFPSPFVKILLDIIFLVIQESNLKKPVMCATKTLEMLVKNAKEHTNTFRSFYSDQQQLFVANSSKRYRIRKNPGTRLIMHTLLKGIPDEEFFRESMNFLLKRQATSEASAAALYLLEALVSDPDLKVKIADYLLDIMLTSLRTLNDSDYEISNAGVQVFNALTIRLLGTKSETGSSELSAVELLQFHPEMKLMLEELLFSDTSSVEMIVTILCFLSHTHFNNRLYISGELFDHKKLKIFFSDSHVAKYAVDAYVSSCPLNCLYTNILHDIEHLLNNTVHGNLLFYSVYAIEKQYSRFIIYNRFPKLEQKLQDLFMKLFKKLTDDPLHLQKMCAVIHDGQLPFEDGHELISFALRDTNNLSHWLIFLLNYTEEKYLPKCLDIALQSDLGELTITNSLSAIEKRLSQDLSCSSDCSSDLLVILIKRLSMFRNPSAAILLHFSNIVRYLLKNHPDIGKIADQLDSGEFVSKSNVIIQEIWLQMYCVKKSLTCDDITEYGKLIDNLIKIVKDGDKDKCQYVSKLLKYIHLKAIVPTKRSNVIYMLVILAIKVDDYEDLNNYFSTLSGENLNIRQHLCWLLNKNVLCKFVVDTKDVQKLTVMLMKTVCAIELFDGGNNSFYFKSSDATGQFSLIIYTSELLQQLYSEL